MVDQRAQWKGFLKFGEVSAGIALYTATSTSDRISFNTVNKATGNRVNRVFIDPDEVAATVPESDKTLEIEAFISCSDVDDVYFDKPYYVAPDRMGSEAFVALRDGMQKSKVAAIARMLLVRRMRTVLIRPHGKGLIATTLNYDYEVRSSLQAFEGMPKVKIEGEMLDLAKHLISTKKGEFDPASFDDRYEAALEAIVKTKIEGKPVPKRKKVEVSSPNDLLSALRESAGLLKATDNKPKRTAANANAGKGRQRAARGVASKSAASKAAPQRKPA